VLVRWAPVVQGFRAVRMRFQRVATFPVGVVYLVPQLDGRLHDLRLVVEAYPRCPPYDGEHPDP